MIIIWIIYHLNEYRKRLLVKNYKQICYLGYFKGELNRLKLM